MLQFLKNIFSFKCPRCHKGNLFINKWYNITDGNKMVEKCSLCSQRTELEPGFYQGTGYVSYGLTVGISIVTFIAWIAATGYGFRNKEVLLWFPLNVILLIALQPWLMRLSRVLWLTMFFHGDDKFHPNNTKK